MTQQPATLSRPELAEKLSGKPVAFISVFDKTGLEPVARALTEKYGYALLSTGGTKKYLEERGIPAIESSEITGFENLVGGRVKSLHPEIFAGILAERHPGHRADYEPPALLIDTVMVTLYPFEQELASRELVSAKDALDLLHMIDIGGSALVRSAAKNFQSVNVLCDSSMYDEFLAELEAGKGRTSVDFRKKLALKAFSRSSQYDATIAQYFATDLEAPSASAEVLDETLMVPLKRLQTMRYGENPHQKAALYGLSAQSADFACLQGKELSYNNILDMEAGWGIVREFEDQPACAIIKHNNPCGVATSIRSTEDAWQAALDTDPLSAFGGIVAFNVPVDVATASRMKDVFLEVIVAPEFEVEALEILSAKKNLRLVKREFLPMLPDSRLQFRQVSPELFLVQYDDPAVETRVEVLSHRGEVRVTGEHKPTEQEVADLLFAWKVARHAKSNAIVLAKDGRTVGIGAGHTSRIAALEQALKTACDEAKDAVMASDGFLPVVDNIHAAAQARISAILQPGGSLKDADVLAEANKYDIAMLTTGVREFRH